MSGDGFLHRYFLNNGRKPIHKWVHYFDAYERHFERFRGKQPVMIEIGVSAGGSLEMWREYFGTGCKIIGIDINPDCKKHESDGIEVFIGSQDDPNITTAILTKYPVIDIVLDDGSHISSHMISSFELLYNRISPNGVYFIEDTHTNYWKRWNGGVSKSGSFMEFSKNKVDEINAVHAEGALPVAEFTSSTDSITFYDSIVVFEKKPQGFRQARFTSGMVYSEQFVGMKDHLPPS